MTFCSFFMPPKASYINMLNKILKVHKFTPFSRPERPNPPSKNPAPTSDDHDEEKNSLVLKIVHAGRLVESYYMAIPASTVLERNPKHVLAKPEVFRSPWNSVVGPESILRPGQKFFLVPNSTIRKLRRRIKKPCEDEASISNTTVNKETNASHLEQRDEEHIVVASDRSGSIITSFKKRSGVKKHVRFAGTDVKHKEGERGEVISKLEQKNGKVLRGKSQGRKRRPPKAITWQPSLKAVNEAQGN